MKSVGSHGSTHHCCCYSWWRWWGIFGICSIWCINFHKWNLTFLFLCSGGVHASIVTRTITCSGSWVYGVVAGRRDIRPVCGLGTEFYRFLTFWSLLLAAHSPAVCFPHGLFPFTTTNLSFRSVIFRKCSLLMNIKNKSSLQYFAWRVFSLSKTFIHQDMLVSCFTHEGSVIGSLEIFRG